MSARVLRGVRVHWASEVWAGVRDGARCHAGPSASQPEVMGAGEQSYAGGCLTGAALRGSGSEQLTVTWQGGSWRDESSALALLLPSTPGLLG